MEINIYNTFLLLFYFLLIIVSNKELDMVRDRLLNLGCSQYNVNNFNLQLFSISILKEKFLKDGNFFVGIFYANYYYYILSILSILFISFYPSNIFSYMLVLYILFVTFVSSFMQYNNIQLKVLKDSILHNKKLKDSLIDNFSLISITNEINIDKDLDIKKITTYNDYLNIDTKMDKLSENEFNEFTLYLDKYIPFKFNDKDIVFSLIDNKFFHFSKVLKDSYFSLNNIRSMDKLILERFIEITVIIFSFYFIGINNV